MSLRDTQINDVDDNGILAGRWQKPYDDGTAPWDWTGSVKIIEEYMENKGRKPVKYGQCWVFSAVTVTGMQSKSQIRNLNFNHVYY